MKGPSHFAVFTLVGILTTIPSVVGAQSPIAWPGLKGSGLPTVYVKDHAGVETRGKLLTFSPDAVVLLIDGSERRIPKREVARIQMRDSLKNGAIIGASFGLATGLLTFGLADCPGQRPSGPCPIAHVAMVPMSAAVWSAIGVGIDALVQGRRTIYADSEGVTTSFSVGGSTSRPTVQLGLSW